MPLDTQRVRAFQRQHCCQSLPKLLYIRHCTDSSQYTANPPEMEAEALSSGQMLSVHKRAATYAGHAVRRVNAAAKSMSHAQSAKC